MSEHDTSEQDIVNFFKAAVPTPTEVNTTTDMSPRWRL